MRATTAKTETQVFLERFNQRVQEEGLVDMKFHVGNVSESVVEGFCREANEIDAAVDQGKFSPIW